MSLISALDLPARLSSIRLLDVRQGDAYTAGHLPGALHADLNRQLSSASDLDHDPAHGGRHPLPPVAIFTAQLGAWGITPDTEIVAYDASGGSNAAARLWWMVKALGHARVSLLDGGLQAALAAGLTLTVKTTSGTPVAPYPSTGWLLPTVDAASVELLRLDPRRKLLDVRSSERWRGGARRRRAGGHVEVVGYAGRRGTRAGSSRRRR